VKAGYLYPQILDTARNTPTSLARRIAADERIVSAESRNLATGPRVITPDFFGLAARASPKRREVAGVKRETDYSHSIVPSGHNALNYRHKYF
jgi:hypothetical protein